MRRRKYKTKKRRDRENFIHAIFYLIFAILVVFGVSDLDPVIRDFIGNSFAFSNSVSYKLEEVPPYSGNSYVVIDNNNPNFSDIDMITTSFEKYSSLDIFGRCGVAYANIGKDIMPTTERESIGAVKPSGWHTVKYDIVEGKYLYNRCHLIGYQLTGENANERNLITCTRYMNTVGMLEFENKVADYVKKTNNHVLYRVTPIYDGNNLVANGVQMEALSVEDNGKGIKFNVFVYNVQDGIEINYKDGSSHLK